MNRGIALLAASLLTLMLSGCGPLIVSPLYPKDWAPLKSVAQKNQCTDITGSYLVKSEPNPIWEKQKPVYYSYKLYNEPFKPPMPGELKNQYLPAYLFNSAYKKNKPANLQMIKLLYRLSQANESARVDIKQTNEDKIDIHIYVNDELAMKYLLTRAGVDLDILGLIPDENTYKCTSQAIEISGKYIYDVGMYISHRDSERGLSGADRYFGKATDGSLVMFVADYFCNGDCQFFNYYKWWRWRPVSN